MTNKFYTNIFTLGNEVYSRGYENGKPFREKREFYPTLYSTCKEETGLKTLDGKNVNKINPGTIRDTRQFVDKYKDVSGFSIYGHTDYTGQYINEHFPGEIVTDPNIIKVAFIDIETKAENGFPKPDSAKEEILLITVKESRTKNVYCFSVKDFEFSDRVESLNPTKVICDSETELLKKFLDYWSYNYPDVVTGWNTTFFDIPYLVNRINNVLGEVYVKKLSPWGKVKDSQIKSKFGKRENTYIIQGIEHLDYLRLYQKFTYTKQESYSLDYISSVELGEKKLENPYETFVDFYKLGWDTFCNYNIIDVELVYKLDKKLGLLSLAYTLAHLAKVNFEDVYGPVKMWESIIYNYLLDRNIVTPIGNSNRKDQQFEGAYVKDPITGFHRWIVSFDLASLYPHLIMMYNMSPETLMNIRLDGITPESIINGLADLSYAKKNNVSVAANGWCFSREKKGFLPELMENLYDSRKKTKKQMISVEKQYEETNSESLENEISRLDNIQMALKILLNSAYGAIGNENFKYFDLRIAEGITLSGQVSIRWIENAFNSMLNKTLKTNKDYVIAVDTDSNYLGLDDLVAMAKQSHKSDNEIVDFLDKFCSDVMQPFIDRSYSKLADYVNAYSQSMSMKREVIASKGIFVKKKKYVLMVHDSEGVRYKEPKLKIMGLEMVKSSTPYIVRESMRKAIGIVMKEDINEFKDYVNTFRNEFMSSSPEEIAFPRSVTDVNKYKGSPIYCKGTPIHVRSALLYNHYIKQNNIEHKYSSIEDGDSIKFVYVRVPNPIYENIIGFNSKLPKEFGLHDFIDYDTQYQKVFVDPLDSIVKHMGWSIEEKASLEDFF